MADVCLLRASVGGDRLGVGGRAVNSPLLAELEGGNTL